MFAKIVKQLHNDTYRYLSTLTAKNATPNELQ